MAHMIVDNLLPRIVSFRGQTLVLKPGENKVDSDLFLSLFHGGDKAKKDPTMEWYFAQGALDVTDADGSDWSPENVKKAKRPSKELLGPNTRVASSMRKAKAKKVNDTTKPEPKEEVPQVAPTRVGGGVPGNVDEALALIRDTNDPAQLEKWMARETRATVVPALIERLDDLD